MAAGKTGELSRLTRGTERKSGVLDFQKFPIDSPFNLQIPAIAVFFRAQPEP